LVGGSNFVPWQLRLQILMEEADLWEHVEKEISKHADPTPLAAQRKKKAKVKRIILDSVKDHFISHISDKTTGKEMFDFVVELFQNFHRCFCKTSL
jgi:hypothetical protein